ncbi:MAG: DmsC/YnfH family molybdoenzyme membrane anchor subunit [Gemmatimonadales bacterium]
MTERPLVAFTLLAQTAVGAFITLGALDVWAGGLTGRPSALAQSAGALLAIGPVMGVALLVSLLHLGTPTAAWRALANLRSSWLSREVLFALLFTGAGALFAILRATGTGTAGLRGAVAAAAALCGVALVYAMSRVYRVRTLPAWDTPLTTVSFFATALLLGTLAVGTGMVLVPGVPDELLAGPLRAIGVAAAAGFGAELAVPGRGARHALRRALLLAGLALCVGSLLGAGRADAALVAAFALALAAQVLGRLLFYVEGSRRVL